MRLNVDVLGCEQRLRARNGGALGDIHELAAPVVAAARIAFRVFVGQHRSGRLEHGTAHEIFRGDQLEAVVLPLDLMLDRLRNLGVGLRERTPHGERARCR